MEDSNNVQDPIPGSSLAMTIELTVEEETDIPKVCAISVDEVPTLGVCRDVVPPAEHGSQHGVFIAPQSRQARGKVSPSDVKGDNLRKLERNHHSFQTGTGKKLWGSSMSVCLGLTDHNHSVIPI